MSLDKAIEHGKEKRKKYRGSKAIDCTCRNHGSCDWCRENREYKNLKRKASANEQKKEYDEEFRNADQKGQKWIQVI